MAILMLSKEYFFTEIIYQHHTCTIYSITLANKVVHLTFSHEQHLHAVTLLRSTYGNCISNKQTDQYSPLIGQLEEYLTGRRQKFALPLALLFLRRGTPFQQQVWQQLDHIPYGKTRTYGCLATAIGAPKAARAVGQALNSNPIALIIPCHRVVAAQGLGGFSGGVAIKEWLLRLEKKKAGGEEKQGWANNAGLTTDR